MMLSWGLNHYGLAAIVLLVVSSLYFATRALVKIYPEKGREMRQTVDKLVKDQLLLRLVTVMTIVIVSAILALSNVLSEGIIALFSSVAGYVLGGVPRKKSQEERITGEQDNSPDDRTSLG